MPERCLGGRAGSARRPGRPDAAQAPSPEARRSSSACPRSLLVLFIVSVEVTSTSRLLFVLPLHEAVLRELGRRRPTRTSSAQVCHYPPGMKSFFRTKIEGLVMVGRYWTKLYVKSKPWAEIQDESCLRPGCHDRRLLEGQVAFGKVVFDHKAHFEDLKRGKTAALHELPFPDRPGRAHHRHRSSCFICHFKDKTPETAGRRNARSATGRTRSWPDKERFDHTVVLRPKASAATSATAGSSPGDGEVPRETCDKCHFERDRLEKYGDTDLMHRTHITANKIECDQCHREIEHKIVKDIETIADCRTCHTGDPRRPEDPLHGRRAARASPIATPNVMLEKGPELQGLPYVPRGGRPRSVKARTLTSRGRGLRILPRPRFRPDPQELAGFDRDEAGRDQGDLRPGPRPRSGRRRGRRGTEAGRPPQGGPLQHRCRGEGQERPQHDLFPGAAVGGAGEDPRGARRRRVGLPARGDEPARSAKRRTPA